MITKWDLRDLVADGLTDAQIARKCFCSHSTVTRLRAEYGIARYDVVHDRGRYLRMKELDLTDAQIIYILGCTLSALRSWKSRENLIYEGASKYEKRI